MSGVIVPEVVVEAVEAGSATSLSVVAVVSLIAFLVVREFSNASEKRKAKVLSEHLLVAIVPLIIVFVLTVTWKVLDVI
jgi:hypothetical protein